MKTFSQIARMLLGLMFTVFGLNGFLHFIPMGGMPTGLAGQFLGALAGSHYLSVVFAVELLGGVLLLVNRYVALGLTVLAPVIVNIILFHTFLEPAGAPLAIAALVLWIVAAYGVRKIYAGLLQPRVQA